MTDTDTMNTDTAELGKARRAALHDGNLPRLERMLEIRMLEERAHGLFDEGLLVGSMHGSEGQEAVSVGLASVTEATDVFTCTYRSHGVALALGITPAEILGEMAGRTAGCIGGLGGSMHLVGMHVGLLPTFAVVGSGIPVAAGAAMTAQVRGNGGMAVAVFGDGATNIGAFHETLNLAAVWNLPVLFVIENNLYGEYSATSSTAKLENLADRGGSYGIPSAVVDGQDVDAVRAAAQRFVDEIRSGGGPRLLEAKTYRYGGHSRNDAGAYRSADEVEAWRQRDPISILRDRLIQAGELDDAAYEQLRVEVGERIEAGVDVVRQSPAPEFSAMFAHVYAGG